MPATIIVKANLHPGRRARLFNDGQDRLFLTVGSSDSLFQPSKSGTFHIYGLCHEVAHLAMYRAIRDHSWATTAATEGWAHYLGSRIVDELHKRQCPDLWPVGSERGLCSSSQDNPIPSKTQSAGPRTSCPVKTATTASPGYRSREVTLLCSG